MLIITEGRGLYALLPMLTGLTGSKLLEVSLDLERTIEPHPYSILALSVGIILGALFIRWMRRHDKQARILVDLETQETFRCVPKDTFYGVSLDSWAIVWMVIASLGAIGALHELFAG